MALEKSESAEVCWIFVLMVILLSTCFLVQDALAQDSFNKSFQWSYGGYSWTWSLSIPQSLYNAYKLVSVYERTRYSDYSFLVTTQDSYVRQVANKLHESATQNGYGAFDEVSFILAFVQSLPYTSDSVTTGYDEYPRFPIETLVDDGGDCEDTAILFATLVLILNYDAIFISPPDHLAAGVWGKDLTGYYYTYNSRTYYYCETTGDYWKIGEMPDAYKGASATLYSIDESRQYVPSQNAPDIPSTPGQGGTTTSPGQALATMMGIVLLIAIPALLLLARSRKPKPEEHVPVPPTMYSSDVEKDKDAKKALEKPEIRTFFCRYCGAENKADAVFCEKCGKKIG